MNREVRTRASPAMPGGLFAPLAYPLALLRVELARTRSEAGA